MLWYRNFEKSVSLLHTFRTEIRDPRLRRRCSAHYLMDGFSLCSADSLTAGPPDCTLRPFSAAPENRGSLFRKVERGEQEDEEEERGGASPGG